MRRYTIAVNGRRYGLSVRELGADRFEVDLDGRRLDVSLVDEADVPSAAITPEMEVALGVVRQAHHERTLGVPAPTQTGAAVAPAPVARPAVPNTAAIAGAGTLTAPMPGAIVSVAVAPGARVRRGDVLLTLEAMKMMNAIRAPRDAVVSEIAVAAGQTVAFGDALMRFEG
jgi:glutaconyl-CoA/methylmalonyl-CoA decarboxylase subunit gamma